MGLISAIKKFNPAKALDTLTAVYAHPLQSLGAAISPTKTIAQVAEKHFEQSLGGQVVDIVKGGAGLAATAVLAPIVAPKVAAAIGVKGALIGTLIGGAAITSPTIREHIAGLVAEPLKPGKEVGETYEKIFGDKDKDLESKDWKNIFLTAFKFGGYSAGLVALAAAGIYVTQKMRDWLDNYKDETIPTTPITPTQPVLSSTPQETTGLEQPIGAVKAATTRKRRSKKPVMPMRISQNVRVNVNQKLYKRGNTSLYYG